MKITILNDLECFNDPEFKFDPKHHKYAYDGFPMESVTRFIHHFHLPFKQDYWSKQKAEETGVTQEEILKAWKQKNDYANEVGHETHLWIENYYNKIWQAIPTNLDIIHRINKFNKVYADQLYKLDPLKFEVRIFSKKWKIAGTIDALFIKHGRIYIVDYKTNGDFTTDDHPKGRYEKLLYPFENFYKNHINEYSIQISLYAAILKEWGFDVAGGYLLHIGPGDDDAKLYPCVNMVPDLEKYLNESFVRITDNKKES